MYSGDGYSQIIQVTSDDLSEFTCGKTRSTLTLVEHLKHGGATVSVISPPSHPMRFVVRAFCYVVSAVDKPTGKIMRLYTYSIPFMRRRLSLAIDAAESLGQQYVVHARDFLSLLAFERLRPPGSLVRTVLTLHCLGSAADELITEGFLRRGSRAERRIRSEETQALDAADAIVVTTERGRRELLAAFPDIDDAKISVIPNPVEIAHAHNPASRAELGVAEDEFLVFVACRMKRIKRLDLLLEAIDLARRDIPKLRLVVAGDGYGRREFVHGIHQRELEEVVTLLGRRADVPDLMQLADVVVLTSERESFGRVLAEGAAVGRALLAFDVGGVTDIILDGETGCLVPFGDVHAFADALVGLAHDPARRLALGMSARERSSLFAPSAVTGSYAALFDELCAEPGLPVTLGVPLPLSEAG